MYQVLLFFLTVFCSFARLQEICPDFISCHTSDTPESCPPGTFYREKISLFRCCPECAHLKNEGEECQFTSECQPGLLCNDYHKCDKDTKQACEYYKRFDEIYKKTKYWKPKCLANGSFAPKQCKGEPMSGKCFCVDERGNRIFGEAEWSKAQNMTCACSRLVEKLKKINSDTSMHCDAIGNFEPLQCDQNICWCANPKTGIPYTLMVPIEMMVSLPCYNRNEAGAQFYRQCDSITHQMEVINSLMHNHGTVGIKLSGTKCNYDGSYYRVQPYKEKKRCVYINNSPLTEAVESTDADCNCAYDRHVSQQQQVEFLADCQPNGNYRNRQNQNGILFCIDKDGFHYSNDPNDCPLKKSVFIQR